MKVVLLTHTPEPEQTIVKATRTCYQSFEKQSETSDQKLLAHIAKNDESPLEFASFTFVVSDISRVTSHQLVRHRVASYAQKSQRYCSEEGFAYVVPPTIEENPEAKEIYAAMMHDANENYNKLKELGIKNEDARYLIPNGCTTELVCCFNARSLRHFIKLRSSPKSQWEIRNLASVMKNLVAEVAPTLVIDLP